MEKSIFPSLCILYPLPKQLKLLFQLCEPTRFRCCSLWECLFQGDAVLQGDTVISKALDNRSGCAVVVKAIKELKKTDNEIYFVFTVQEEVGLRGAKTAAFSIKPDIAIAVMLQ